MLVLKIGGFCHEDKLLPPKWCVADFADEMQSDAMVGKIFMDDFKIKGEEEMMDDI